MNRVERYEIVVDRMTTIYTMELTWCIRLCNPRSTKNQKTTMRDWECTKCTVMNYIVLYIRMRNGSEGNGNLVRLLEENQWKKSTKSASRLKENFNKNSHRQIEFKQKCNVLKCVVNIFSLVIFIFSIEVNSLTS